MLRLDGTTLVVGLGKSGLSAARALQALGAAFAVTDSRADPPGLAALRAEFPDAPCYLGGFDPAVFAARLTQVPVAAITGSNGKSTVTTLLGLMAERAGVRAAVGGNLGTPALELWLRDERNAAVAPEVYVLELSSFQLETTHSLNARVATVLNISPDHMDRYDSLDDYIAAKRRVRDAGGQRRRSGGDGDGRAGAERRAFHPGRAARR